MRIVLARAHTKNSSSVNDNKMIDILKELN